MSVESLCWRCVHVGVTGDRLAIDGIPVWKRRWRLIRDNVARLPHPTRPHQLHWFGLYEVRNLWSSARFAASELSNGVWGFYVEVPAPLRVPGPASMTSRSASGVE